MYFILLILFTVTLRVYSFSSLTLTFTHPTGFMRAINKRYDRIQKYCKHSQALSDFDLLRNHEAITSPKISSH